MNALLNESIHLRKSSFQLWSLAFFCFTISIAILNSRIHYQKKVHAQELIKKEHEKQLNQVYSWYDLGKKGPEDRPWVDITTPFWATWYANKHIYIESKPLTMLASNSAVAIPETKRISIWSTPFDSDILPEIQNYELKLPIDFDFTFVWLYLMPLVLIILFFSTPGYETDLGLTQFIRVLTPKNSRWITHRIVFLTSVITFLLILFWIVGFILFDAKTIVAEYTTYGGLLLGYTFFWAFLLPRFCKIGMRRNEIALKMISLWILLVIVIPSSIKVLLTPPNPAKIQLELAEMGEVLSDSVYAKPVSKIWEHVQVAIPELKTEFSQVDTSAFTPDQKNGLYRTYYVLSLLNGHEKVIHDLEKEIHEQYKWNWINPVGFIHATLLQLSQSDVNALLTYRKKVLESVRRLHIKLVTYELASKQFDRKSFELFTLENLSQH